MDFNLYNYVGNSPLKFVDPLGLDSWNGSSNNLGNGSGSSSGVPSGTSSNPSSLTGMTSNGNTNTYSWGKSTENVSGKLTGTDTTGKKVDTVPKELTATAEKLKLTPEEQRRLMLNFVKTPRRRFMQKLCPKAVRNSQFRCKATLV